MTVIIDFQAVNRCFFYISLSKDEIIYCQKTPPAILMVASLQYYQVCVAFYQYFITQIINTVQYPAVTDRTGRDNGISKSKYDTLESEESYKINTSIYF